MTRTVGRCGLCGGRVTVPDIWMGTTPPEPTCESCHAVVAPDLGVPTLPMRRPIRPLTVEELRQDRFLPANVPDVELQAYVKRWNAARFA